MRRRLLVLTAVAAALSGACAPDGNQQTATDTIASSDDEGSSDAAVGSSDSSSVPTLDGTVVEPPSEECETAAAIVQDDVALALAADQSSADIVRVLEASIADALERLAASDTGLAAPAAALAALASDDLAAAASRTVIAFDQAMIAECDLRFTKAGVLRPDADPDDALAGLGLARELGDTCETSAALRWADAHWRAAPDGGEQDRLGVVVRASLGALRLGDVDDDEVEFDLPDDVERADLSGGSLSPEHRIAIVRLDADLRRACDAGLELGGLLMERTVGPSAAALAALPQPDWAEPSSVTADVAHARWCAVADDIYAGDVAVAASEAYELVAGDRLGLDLRLLLGALRVASRSGGSVATLADVRDTIAATAIIERADLSGSGLLTPDERRVVADLDHILVANCGVGLSTQLGVLGPYGNRRPFDDPDAQPGNAPTTTAVPDTSTTSTSLPGRLPDTTVAVVGDSLTLGAQAEITDTLGRLGLGVVEVDGQVSRRMTSSTDTIRSGLAVVEEIAATSAPRIWVIALGTNDVASGSSPQSIRESVQRVLAAIPADALVVWVDTWIRDERNAVIAGNLIIRDVVAQRPGAVVADFFSYGDDDGIVGGDGVHLTTAGRRLFANVMANGIADVLGRNPLFDLAADPPPLVTVPFATAPPVATTLAATTTTNPGSATTTTTTIDGASSTTTTTSTTSTASTAAPTTSTTTTTTTVAG